MLISTVHADSKLHSFLSYYMFMLQMKFYCVSNLHYMKTYLDMTLLLSLRPG